VRGNQGSLRDEGRGKAQDLWEKNGISRKAYLQGEIGELNNSKEGDASSAKAVYSRPGNSTIMSSQEGKKTRHHQACGLKGLGAAYQQVCNEAKQTIGSGTGTQMARKEVNTKAPQSWGSLKRELVE